MKISIWNTVITVWLAAVCGCGGKQPPPVPTDTEDVGSVMDQGEHLLVEPEGEPEALLGRPVTVKPEGVEIKEALAPGCKVSVHDKMSDWDRTYHQETKDTAGFSANLEKIASLTAQYKQGVRIEAKVHNEKVLTADLSGTCGDLVIKSVKVGTGQREFQYYKQVGGGASAGWKWVSISGGGKSTEDLGATLSWSKSQAWAFTVGSAADTNQAELEIKMPTPIVVGQTVTPKIINKGERDLWLIVISCDQNKSCVVLRPSKTNRVEKVSAHQTSTLEPMAPSAPSRERLIVYGFPEEGDYKDFSPPAGDLTEEEHTEYTTGLEERLKAILAKRWTKAEFRYVVE
jgi:hypothetical protein